MKRHDCFILTRDYRSESAVLLSAVACMEVFDHSCFLSAFWLIGLISRIKKQCFSLIRKIPFVGGAVSISGDSVPSFPSRCALTIV